MGTRSPASDDRFSLVCDGLVVEYGSSRAVDDVSFTVRRGDVFGLLGPNGAGKTSIIRALTTVIEPTAGEAHICGIPLADATTVRRRIGVLPESNGYPNGQTALGYLRFYGQLFGVPADCARWRAARLLDQLGLGLHHQQRIGTFSRGMRQRLGIARAMINDPDVLFLDEPTLGLDPAGQDEVLGYLAETAATGHITVVLCSHLLDEVERTCGTIAIVHRGRLVASGDLAEVAHVAGITATALVTTDPGLTAEAIGALDGDDSVVAADRTSRPGEIAVRLRGPATSANALAERLIGVGIPILAIELRGARLSDSFLSLTGTPSRQLVAGPSR